MNEHLTLGDTTLIYLNKLQISIIDTEDLNKINSYNWFALFSPNTNSFYCTSIILINNKKSFLSMHREIMNTAKDLQVDHINHKTLNNSKSNLRNVTNQQNQRNSCDIKHIPINIAGSIHIEINFKCE
jgi:hypothetical protein